MRVLFTAVLLGITFHLPMFAEEAAVSSQQSEWEKSAQLADLTSRFSGNEALSTIKKLLEEGVNPNSEDAYGNTPLLLLCEALELDYRYRTEPHYSKAVDQAAILLLEHQADPLHENKKGYNAMFYLQGKPELLKQLADKKLLPPELAVRVPHEERALLRYMRLRVAQAATANEASRAYLSRVYCAPAYERATELLQKYMQAEMKRHIPRAAMETTLAFMRLGQPEGAEKFIDDLPVWQHSEHFLEEVPAHLLHTLNALEWKVKPAQLQTALERLDSLLPKEDGELIDCNAAAPMCDLLVMLDRQSPQEQTKLLERFSRSRDNRLAYTALSLRLHRKGLPCPGKEILPEGKGISDLTEPQKRVLLCAEVDAALRHADLEALTPENVKSARQAMAEFGVKAHAELLDGLVDEQGNITISQDGLNRLSEEYTALPGPSPQVVLARYILNHPATFSAPAGKNESH